MIPPGMSKHWDDLVPWQQAMLIAYEQIRGLEELEDLKATIGAKI